MGMKKLILVMGILLINACSKDPYPWTDSMLPDWAVQSLSQPSKVLIERVDAGPVNDVSPFLWCYKYKDVIIVYDFDKQGSIIKRTIWKN